MKTTLAILFSFVLTNVAQAQVSISPNPLEGTAIISKDCTDCVIESIILYDMAKKVFYEKIFEPGKFEYCEIETDNLQTGYYFLQIIFTDGSGAEKIVRKKLLRQ